jgi:hypothetical protein
MVIGAGVASEAATASCERGGIFECGLHRDLHPVDLLLVTLARGKENDEEGEQQRDEIRVGHQPALVVDVFGMLLLRHE